MKKQILAVIDWSRGLWVLHYRNDAGDVIIEPTGFSANTPSIVVCNALQKDRPRFAVFAKLG